MSTQQERPGPGREGHGFAHGRGQHGAEHQERGERLDRLDRMIKEGKITAEQAAQYRAWESARPDRSAGKEKYMEWVKSRPNMPDFPSGRPHGNAGQ